MVQDYTTKLNKKVRKLGLRMALSQKLYEGNLIVVDELVAPTFKTKDVSKLLSVFGVAGRYGTTALLLDQTGDRSVEDLEEEEEDPTRLVLSGVNANVKVAAQNLFKVKVLNQLGANVYDILKYEKLLISLSAIRELERRLKG